MSKPGLTKKQRAKLGPYMRDIANRLGLRDWTIQLEHEAIGSDEPQAAMCELTFGQRLAKISFRGDFVNRDRADQRNIVVHELLHCHLDAWPDLCGVRDLIGKPAHLILTRSLNREIEMTTDALANAIAPLLPLPPKLRKGS